MRSKHFLGLCLAVGSFAAAGLVTGCGIDTTTSTSTSGSGGSGGESTATTATSSTGTGTTTSSTGTGGGASNHDFATATDIEVNAMQNTPGELADADTTTDYYKFPGKAGQRITVVVNAQSLAPNGDGNDPSIVDVVVTLFDANKQQIAQNDDSWPRFSTDAQVFTVLPADGDYYIAIASCNTVFPSGGCGVAGDITSLQYDFFVNDVAQITTPEVNEVTAPNKEPNDDKSVASTFTYAVPMGAKVGQYGFYDIDGSFKDGADVDVFELKLPADVEFDAAQRVHAEFWVQPITANNGTGAAANAVYSLTDANGVVLAEADQKNYSSSDSPTSGPINLSVPVEAGKTYYLFVKHPGGASDPVKDFYFVKHFVGSFYYGQYEGAVDANDTFDKAQALTSPAMTNNFYVDGDLLPAGDVDFYSFDTTGKTKVSLLCDAQRAGSGLRNATFTLTDTSGNVLVPGKSVLSEKADQDVVLVGPTAVTLPANTKMVLLKVEGTQDATVTSSFYHCSIIPG